MAKKKKAKKKTKSSWSYRRAPRIGAAPVWPSDFAGSSSPPSGWTVFSRFCFG